MRAAKPLRVLLVEDHEVVAEALVGLLEDQSDIEPVGRVALAADVIAAVLTERPTVVVMDYHLPDADGVTATQQLLSACPDVKVVFLTAEADDHVLVNALDAGAAAFVSKNTSAAELVAAIRAAAAGGSYFSPDVLERLVRLRHGPSAPDNNLLSERERAVLTHCASGASPDQIARSMNLSVHTVRNYLRRAMTKLDAHTRLEAVLAAVRAGLIDLST